MITDTHIITTDSLRITPYVLPLSSPPLSLSHVMAQWLCYSLHSAFTFTQCITSQIKLVLLQLFYFILCYNMFFALGLGVEAETSNNNYKYCML